MSESMSKFRDELLSGDTLRYTVNRISSPDYQKRKNHLIAIEGIDGVGKTTLVNTLANLKQVLCWSTPINKINREIRKEIDKNAFQDPTARFDFYTRSNKTDSENYIEPALSSGKDVFLDRYSLSTIVYNYILGANLENHPDVVHDNRTDTVIPSATILLSLDENSRKKRIIKKRREQGVYHDGDLEDESRLLSSCLKVYNQLTQYGLIKIDISGLETPEIIQTVFQKLEAIGIFIK